MEVQAVAQGVCTNCDNEDDNWSADRQYNDEGMDYWLTCECSAHAVVRISEDGLAAMGAVTHESATWNEGNDD